MMMPMIVSGLVCTLFGVVLAEVCFQNVQPTMDELVLQLQRLHTKLAIQESKTIAVEAKMEAKMAGLSNSMEAKIEKNVNSSMNVAVSDLRGTIASEVSEAKSQLNVSEQAASFSAEASSSSLISNGAVVKFNQVHYKYPNTSIYGYNPNTGRFKCPYDGNYVFFATITMEYGYTGYGKFDIQKEGRHLQYMIGNINENIVYQPMSAMVVTRCGKGESVYVKNVQGNKRYVHAHSHFAGYKIA